MSNFIKAQLRELEGRIAALEAKAKGDVVVATAVNISLPERPLPDLTGFGTGFVAALREAGITTVEQAQALSDEELIALKGIGEASVEKIRSW